MKIFQLSMILVLLSAGQVSSQQKNIKVLPVAEGWAGNTVNTAIFRKNSLTTNNGFQYIGFYDSQGYLTLGKRKLGSDNWEIKRSVYGGNVRDAHNIISIAVDGRDYLHVSWDHHNNSLRYCKTIRPGSLELGEKEKMTGQQESKVSYPEFHKLPNGDLLFVYRDGGSGGGNMIMNRYEPTTAKWTRLHDNLISGEGKRNAYWQACVDNAGTIHISWVWRESPDVASNHDMGYARSRDGGLTWENSLSQPYALPITESTAEYACKIPQKMELINQTSMSCDEGGRPFIVSYWRDTVSGFPQYQLLYNVEAGWKQRTLGFRKSGFSLSGMGTKKIPISRPQVLVSGKDKNASLLILFRDEERDNKASVLSLRNIESEEWKISDLNDRSLSSWEPTYDIDLWKKHKILSLFIQNATQVDGEGVSTSLPQLISVLDWKPKF